MAQKAFIWCLVTFYDSAGKTFPEHLSYGSRAFASTVEVFILEKEWGEVRSNL